jgi:short-subunit dehydrogenase
MRKDKTVQNDSGSIETKANSINDAFDKLEQRLGNNAPAQAETVKTTDINTETVMNEVDIWRKRVVIITGGSHGIGLAIARQFTLFADIVYSLSRTKSEDDSINFFQTDITNPDEVKEAIRQIHYKEGQIDILINCAGIGIAGAVEELQERNIIKVVNTNFLGAVWASQAVVPYMREAKHGLILNISCANASNITPFTSIYAASKAGLETFALSLNKELKPCRIRAANVLLANIKTDFTENRIKQESHEPVYKYRLSKFIGKCEYDEQNGASPAIIAKLLYKLTNKKIHKIPTTIVVGTKNKINLFFKRFLPR